MAPLVKDVCARKIAPNERVHRVTKEHHIRQQGGYGLREASDGHVRHESEGRRLRDVNTHEWWNVDVRGRSGGQ